MTENFLTIKIMLLGIINLKAFDINFNLIKNGDFYLHFLLEIL
jgi:hypothetical protein